MFSSTTHSAIAFGNPTKPRKRVKINTPQMTVKIIADSFADSSSACVSSFRFMPWNSAMTKTLKAPSAPASVGVAQPNSML